MNGSERDWHDDLLDRALASYVESEPRRGLEQRVVRRVAVRRRRQRAFVWAVAACFALMLIVGLTRPVNEVTVPAIVARAPVPPPMMTFRPSLVSARRIKRLTAIKESFAKRDVFPTPMPLTEQERIALGFLRSDLQAVAILPQTGAPIEIPEIRIDPILDGGSE